MRITKIICLCLIVSISQQRTIAQAQTFVNPLLSSGADPWCIYKNGYFYYTNTLGNRIDIWKTKSISDLPTAERKTVWSPPATGPYSKQIWAPEIHYLQGKWYIYFAADSGRNEDHRLWVLENESADPLQGTWKVKGKLTTPGDKWSIDGSVFFYKKSMYLVWSGWEGDVNGQQNIYISKMRNPWTVENKRVLISSPTYNWERSGDIKHGNSIEQVYVNEGPQVLVHHGNLFLIYSASGCWTDNYALGMLQKTGKNILDATSWKKHPEPVFTRSVQCKVFAPGHNCFFKSPDGKEDWILYHANSEPAQGCGRFRSPRAQKFTWTSDGYPYFGEPVEENLPLIVPSETAAKKETETK